MPTSTRAAKNRLIRMAVRRTVKSWMICPNREESFFMMQTPFIAQEISRFPTIIMYFRERFKFGNG